MRRGCMKQICLVGKARPKTVGHQGSTAPIDGFQGFVDSNNLTTCKGCQLAVPINSNTRRCAGCSQGTGGSFPKSSGRSEHARLYVDSSARRDFEPTGIEPTFEPTGKSASRTPTPGNTLIDEGQADDERVDPAAQAARDALVAGLPNLATASAPLPPPRKRRGVAPREPWSEDSNTNSSVTATVADDSGGEPFRFAT